MAIAALFLAAKKQEMKLKETRGPTSQDYTPETQRTLTKHHLLKTLQPQTLENISGSNHCTWIYAKDQGGDLELTQALVIHSHN